MATIKDIAKLAGVSHGTVSNVLNGRGNVSSAKLEAVTRAAQQMGYQLNAQAQSLRAQKSNAVALVLPNVTAEQHYQLYQGLRQHLQKSFDGELDLYLTDDLPTTEQNTLKKLASHAYQHVITVSCLDNASEYYNALKLSPEKIWFVYRTPKDAVRNINLDYRQAAQAIGLDIIKKKYSVVGLLTDPMHYSYVKMFSQTLSQVLDNSGYQVKLIVHSSPLAESYKTAFAFFNGTPPDALVAMDGEKARDFTIASYLGSTTSCPPIYLLNDKEMFIQPQNFCYQMNYARLGMLIAQKITGDEAISKTLPTVIPNRGFSLEMQLNKVPAGNVGDMLNLLMLPGPSTEALNKLLPHFFRMTGIKVHLSTFRYDELFNILTHLDLYPYYDILRIDLACLPWFAKNTLKPIHEVSPALLDLLHSYSEQIVDIFGTVNSTCYTIPFDSSSQLLFYRRDLFQDTLIRRKFFERYGKDLQVPVTFSEFDTIASFFSSIHQPGDPLRPMGTSVTLGNSALIATEFLARYYAMGGRILHEDAVPRLEANIAIPALQDYLKQLTFSRHLDEEWWNASVTQFEQGQLAMQISYMNLFNDVAHSPIFPSLGYAPIPGGSPQLGGGSLGVSRYSEKHGQIELFFKWLFSREITEHRVLLGGSSAQQSIYQNQQIIQQYPWFNLLQASARTGIRESCQLDGTPYNLRKAEIVIGQGIANVINHIMTVEQAISSINSQLK